LSFNAIVHFPACPPNLTRSPGASELLMKPAEINHRLTDVLSHCSRILGIY
jgi:hypothetical protein